MYNSWCQRYNWLIAYNGKEVMSSNPGRVELGVLGTSALRSH